MTKSNFSCLAAIRRLLISGNPKDPAILKTLLSCGPRGGTQGATPSSGVQRVWGPLSESGQGGWKTRPSPKTFLDHPPTIRFPPPFWRLSVISLKRKRHRPDQSQFLRPPKVVLDSTLCSTFPPPPNSRRYVLPPPQPLPNLKGLGIRPLVSASRGLGHLTAPERLSGASGRLFRGLGPRKGVRSQRSGKRRWATQRPRSLVAQCCTV